MLNTILCLALATQAKPIDLLMQGLQPGAYGYAYGGQTQGEIVKGDVPVLRYRGDNTEWSGWTFHLAWSWRRATRQSPPASPIRR